MTITDDKPMSEIATVNLRWRDRPHAVMSSFRFLAKRDRRPEANANKVGF
jgi:hypothetical protein